MNNQDLSLDAEIDRILQKSFLDIRKRIVTLVAKHNKKQTKKVSLPPPTLSTKVHSSSSRKPNEKERERKVRYKKDEEHFSSRSVSESSDD